MSREPTPTYPMDASIGICAWCTDLATGWDVVHRTEQWETRVPACPRCLASLQGAAEKGRGPGETVWERRQLAWGTHDLGAIAAVRLDSLHPGHPAVVVWDELRRAWWEVFCAEARARTDRGYRYSL